MTTLALDAFSDTLLRVAIVFVLIGVVLLLMNRIFGRGQGPRSEQLQKKYAKLTREKLDAIPDADLVEAVVANIMAKQDPKNPQPYYMLPLLSLGRSAVYSVWLIDCELRVNGFDVLVHGPSAPFCEPARNGFALIGAERCAAALAEAATLTEEHDLAACHDRYLAAAEEETPLARCVTYIRDNPNEFVDDPLPSSEAEPTEQGEG